MSRSVQLYNYTHTHTHARTRMYVQTKRAIVNFSRIYKSRGDVFERVFFFQYGQKIPFGSKKKKEKVDKETKKLRKFLKISGMKNNEEKTEEDTCANEKVKPGENWSGRDTHAVIDYKVYDLKVEDVIRNFERKMKKIYDNNLNVDFFNNIIIEKGKQNFKLSELAQVVIKSVKFIYFYPYVTGDTQKIIHHLKLKDNTWNPITSNDGQHILLQIPPLTEDIKLKKKKEAKDLLEKIKNDLRNLRHKIRDDIVKNCQGDEWKIVERKKLDTYIKTKTRVIEEIYERYLRTSD
ncbi:ribosome-recycling factor [Plasmodium gonderi]|uniref:Ribosome-recycling factor n=1 Tax=Plasmodium gonderi TaxID=77519 RepID=A0A1Y1JBC4_PLAGO|nr:ribosome-recycling factor [Plasmodium gonderi]GAW79829.1 ribosome-recycling factor [Plasmodium gonderi]